MYMRHLEPPKKVVSNKPGVDGTESHETKAKLPRHLRIRARLRNKYSIKSDKQMPTSELEKTAEDIEAKRRLNLLTWYEEVSKLKKELFDMEKSLTESLVGIDGKLKQKIMKRRQMPFRLPQLSEDELERLPLYMRPKPTKPPIAVQRERNNWAELNERSYQVLQIKLGDIRTRYRCLPGVGDHYRILTTPDPRPEIKTVKMRANIHALNPVPPAHPPGKESKSRKKRVFVTEGVLDNGRGDGHRDLKYNSLDDKMVRQKIIDMYEKDREKNKEENRSGKNEGRYWGMRKQVKKTVLQVKMPEIIKQEERSKARHISVEKQVELWQNKSAVELLDNQEYDIQEAEQREEKEAVSDDTSALPVIEEEVGAELDEPEVDYYEMMDEDEFYRQHPEIERISIKDVKKSRLIRGYEPPMMRLPADVTKFIFDQDCPDELEDSDT